MTALVNELLEKALAETEQSDGSWGSRAVSVKDIYEVTGHCYEPGQVAPGNICRSVEIGDYCAFKKGTKLAVLNEGGTP